jgi:DNA-binding XRE family transcriptional regulator
MIDEKQIRAARAILGWSQEALAEKVEVARATIKNIENCSSLPRADTINRIQVVFEGAGIEFIGGSGVRLKDQFIESFDGPDSNRLLIEDIYATLSAKGGELLIAFLNETRAVNDLGADFLMRESERRRLANIRSRLLVHPNEQHLVANLEDYRIIPDEYFSKHPFFIYGSKLAILCTEPSPRVVILKDQRFADSARKLFEFIWDRTEMPKRKGKPMAVEIKI